MYTSALVVDGMNRSAVRGSPGLNQTIVSGESRSEDTPVLDKAEKFTANVWRAVKIVGIVLLIALAGYVLYKVAKPLIAVAKSVGRTAEAASTAAEGFADAATTVATGFAEGARTFAENPLKWIVQRIVNVVTDIVEAVQSVLVPAAEVPTAPTAVELSTIITSTAEETFVESIPAIVEGATEALPAITPIPF